MKTIWKWTLTPDSVINIPVGGKILAVQTQHGEPQLWALVDPSNFLKPRRFRAYGTGHTMPDNPGEYVGTFQECFGSLVFHVFECE